MLFRERTRYKPTEGHANYNPSDLAVRLLQGRNKPAHGQQLMRALVMTKYLRTIQRRH